MVGASLACALMHEEIRLAVIESVPLKAAHQPSYDDRGLALSLASRRILQAIDVWDKVVINANPIDHVHVSDRGCFGMVRLDAGVLNLDALGHVIIARELGQALFSRIEAAGQVDFICPAEVTAVQLRQDVVDITLTKNKETNKLSSRLLVVADGTHSKIRQQLGIETRTKDYQQTAIVTNVTTEIPHRNTAYERFTEHGPLALLPLREERCALIYTVPTQEAEAVLNLDDEAFLQRIQLWFGKRLGHFQKTGKRRSYPLSLVASEEQIRDRMVLLGNSAHTIHPNGAQGFNLCLRDAAALAEQLSPALRAGNDPGDGELLQAYLASRQADQERVVAFSDRLARLFYNKRLTTTVLRNTGMLITDLVPVIKRDFILQATGIWGRQPAMVRGNKIRSNLPQRAQRTQN